MTIVIMTTTKIFNNPNKIAVENLKLSVSNDGIIRTVPAIDLHWVVKRDLTIFTPAPSSSAVALGELKIWQDTTQCFLDDLKWLLTLQYHKFWSHIVYYPPCMDMLVSFLQEAFPPYLPPHPDNAVMNLYSEAYKKVLTIFSRLVTNKESEIEWMSASYLGQLIYDKFIFTIPIIFDLCLLYGTNNTTHITKLVNTIFHLQPKYNDDLIAAIAFLKQIFSFIALQIDNRNNMDIVPPTLPEIFKGFSQSFGGLKSQAAAAGKNLNFASLHDLTLHLVDCTVTLKIFLEIYPPSRHVLRDQNFHMSIVNLYENTLPCMYERVVELGDPKKEPYNQIFQYLDLIRAELVDMFRLIIATTIDDILSGSSDVEKSVTSYLTIITDSLSEKYFIKDYNGVYPVEMDLEVLCQAYNQMDPLKCDFILQAVIANCYDDDDYSQTPTETVNTNDLINGHHNEENTIDIPIETKQINDIPQEAKMQSLISEVKDILPHLGDGFILKCLEHFDFNSERVINSVLEGNLDESLQALDPSLPIIPQDALDVQFLQTGIDRLNVFDNDEFDVMTRDNIDLSKVHKGKRKPQHKNLAEMLNDKSHVKAMKDKETYTKYSLISDDVDMYEDEYDDTYDGDAAVLVSEGTSEADKRLGFKRAPLRETEECAAESEDSEEEAGSSFNTQPKDSFCVNPEEVRARYQAARDMKYGSKPQRDVIGKAKGQGQDKDVLVSRQKKAANKSTRGNHNRRTGAQWKRTQGLLPS